jgi:hypothetical protein
MVTYNYSVKKSGANNDIQSVINNIVDELSIGPVLENDITVTIGGGNYSGFYIPDGALFTLLGTTKKLIIKAEENVFPIIDYNYSPEEQNIGIDIGAGNPNVVIDGLRVQYFSVGIRAALNSHYPLIKNCIANNNRNVGIYCEQVLEAQVLQNVVVNGDYGIVVRRCRSAALIHNTIFQNGAISSTSNKSISAVWAELALDYGNGIADTGILHLIGNVAWNTSGRCLTLFVQDIERPGAVFSNFNNWVIGDKEEYIVLEDNAYYENQQSTARRVFTNLSSWKALGFDASSKNEDPRFISPLKINNNKNAYSIDLNILNVSPVLNMVPSFAFSPVYASVWLPSYVDSSEFTKDILNNNRNQTQTAAGANDKATAIGFYGQDIFSNPFDTNLNKVCDIDPYYNIIQKTLDIWFPKLQRGYFYSNEREYYLYSRKECKNIGELSKTEFYLPAKIAINKPIEVRVNGIVVDNTYYDLVSNKFILYHKNININSGEEEVQITAQISSWTGSGFHYSDVLYIFKISEGKTKYFLPENYVSIGPVVITDDQAYPTDNDVFSNREFSVSFNQKEERNEIKFANYSNIIFNGQFDYKDEDYKPKSWQNFAALVTPSSKNNPSVCGRFYCLLQNTGFIRKIVPLDIGNPSTLSFYTRSTGRGQCKLTIEVYDINQDLVGYVYASTFELKEKWNRYSLSLNADHTDFDIHTQDELHPLTNLGNISLPENAAFLSFKIEHIYNPAYAANMFVDAVQFEHTNYPTHYHRRFYFSELTVEYETSEEDNFIDTHLAMAPIRSYNTEGFIYIPEIPASVYDGPQSPVVTTLHEWKWPEGRKFVIPWARVKGKDKLRKRAKDKFNKIPQVKPEQLVPVTSYPSIKTIELYPQIPVVKIGNTTGIGIAVKVIDEFNNNYALAGVGLEITDFNINFPGSLYKTTYGLNEQLGTTVLTKTDSSGIVSFKWIPPSEQDCLYIGPTPLKQFITQNQNSISSIRVDYPVYTASGGNIIILDYAGNPIQTTATNPISSTYEATYTSNRSIVTMEFPIKVGSVKVTVDGVSYFENQNNVLDSNQFYVDYVNSLIYIKDRVTNISVEYIPSYVYVVPSNPYVIYIYHDRVFGNYNNTITVGYDISIKLNVNVFDYSLQEHARQEFLLVGQNPLLSKKTTNNNIALDI